MTIKEFENLLKEKNIFYLYFYSPTCDACKVIKPQLKVIKDSIHPIEGDKFDNIADAFEIEYYPTLVRMQNKKGTLYEGQNTIESLLKNLESQK